jgi:hypothetical protein
MKLEILNNIPLSNNPINGISRIGSLKRFVFELEDKFLRCDFKIYALDVDGNILKNSISSPPYVIQTFASNAWQVNPDTGEVVGKTEELTEEQKKTTIGEYDFFALYAENSIQLYPLLYQKCISALQLGRYDV